MGGVTGGGGERVSTAVGCARVSTAVAASGWPRLSAVPQFTSSPRGIGQKNTIGQTAGAASRLADGDDIILMAGQPVEIFSRNHGSFP